jgi:hypothetical protein
MQHQIKKALGLVAGAAAATALVVAPSASAHEVDVVGGKTKLELDKKVTNSLADLGVTAKGTKYAVKAGLYSFHALNDGGGGEISHKGSLTLKGDGAKVKLAKFDINLPIAEHGRRHGEEGTLSAVVGGERIDVATLGTKKYEVLDKKPGFTGLGVELNKDAAKLLNESFDVKAFKKGMKLGSLSNKSEIEEHEE